MGRAASRKQRRADVHSGMALVSFRGQKKLVPKTDVPIYVESFKTFQEYKHLIPGCENCNASMQIIVESNNQPGKFDEFILVPIVKDICDDRLK